MQFVTSVRAAFPGLKTEEELAAHRAAAADFIRQGGALCAKDGSRVVGALLFSREPSVLCFLAVDPAIAAGTLLPGSCRLCSPVCRRSAMSLSRPTARAFPEGIAARAFYTRLGFAEGSLTEEFGAPVQNFILRRT